MTKKRNQSKAHPDIRSEAEERLRERQRKAALPPMAEIDAQRLVHELEVHQIELEMQNEELFQSRTELESALKQYSDLYDFAPVGYFTLARNGAIRKANLTGARLLGANRGEIIDRRFGQFLSNDSRPTFNTLLEKVSSTDGIVTSDVALTAVNGQSVWVHIEATRTEDHQECRVVVADITARKKAEEKIHQLNAELERRVLERTADLKAANRELESFAYSVSHDLRGPLRIIDGFSKILLDEYHNILDPQGKEYLHQNRAASQRMAQLIDDLLQMSQVTRHEIEISAVNLTAIAQEIIGEFRESEPTRVVEVSIAKNLVTRGDASLMRILLHNLLQNAWKFTSKRNKGLIEFGSQEIDGKTEFYVRDNGVGFDMTYVQKLFLPFQRLHTTAEFTGAGVGLAIVQRIVKRRGGMVRAEGILNGGATIYFQL